MNTPRRLRLWAVVTVAALAVTGAVGAIAANALSRATERVEQNTAPVLVTSQQLAATLAEADATNIGVFLSGAELDRTQRRLYEGALERASGHVETAAADLADGSASHQDLTTINATLLEFAGLAEVARERNIANDPNAAGILESSIDLVSGEAGMLSNVASVTARAQRELDDDIDAGTVLSLGAVVVALVAGAVIVSGLLMLNRRFKRVINLGLTGSLVVILIYLVWFVLAWFGRSNDLADARDGGYNSIAATAELQTRAFAYKSAEAEAIIGGTELDLERDAAAVEVERLIDQVAALADSDRERAGTDSLSTRWIRYRATSDELASAVARGDRELAAEITAGEGNQAFTGFNTTVEAGLLANRDQFLSGVASAQSRLRWLLIGSILLPLLAAGLAWTGYEQRIGEYR